MTSLEIQKRIDDGPMVVNKFNAIGDAKSAAQAWSKLRHETWCVVWGYGDDGMYYFVERGSGGVLRLGEKLCAMFDGGKSRDVG